MGAHLSGPVDQARFQRHPAPPELPKPLTEDRNSPENCDQCPAPPREGRRWAVWVRGGNPLPSSADLTVAAPSPHRRRPDLDEWTERGLTWSEDDCVPEHEVVCAWCARDAKGWVGRETLEVTNESTSTGGGLKGETTNTANAQQEGATSASLDYQGHSLARTHHVVKMKGVKG